MKSSSVCWLIRTDRSWCSASGRRAFSERTTERLVSYLGHKETVFQNIYDSFDPKRGEPFRNDIVENQVCECSQSCPTSEGGHNWHAMSYHPGSNHSSGPEL
jgi:hypothetical protein